MKSIPLAIGWEMLDRGRWRLILAALGGIALPVLLFAVLRHEGALDLPAEPLEPNAVIGETADAALCLDEIFVSRVLS